MTLLDIHNRLAQFANDHIWPIQNNTLRRLAAWSWLGLMLVYSLFALLVFQPVVLAVIIVLNILIAICSTLGDIQTTITNMFLGFFHTVRGDVRGVFSLHRAARTVAND